MNKDERGMVTAEFALASLIAAAFVVTVAWIAAVLLALGSCQATAAEVARQEARGDAAAAAQAKADAPPGARVTVSRHGKQVDVDVELDARPWTSWVPSVPLHAQAHVLAEEG
ncbi:MAG: hypothetical protein LBR58_03305 [Propionibacteriaceae bacterium]|nr:hypothetical protein [Propionibacteriaceae bacterium]